MNYGVGPASDEPELMVFGPGYGEAIAVHLGEGGWLLVDSCLNSDKRMPASLEYLHAIGVSPEQVVGIVASHWHDDHVRGISTLVEQCPNAELFVSGVFNEKEALAFLSAYSGAPANGLNRGTSELYHSIEKTQQGVIPTIHRSVIVERRNGRQASVYALSPTTEGQRRALAHFAAFVPNVNAPINNAPPDQKPNSESVVVHIDFGDDAILLGSDLEHDGEAGWEGIVNSVFGRSRPKGGIYKVAHHGSITAEFQGIWSVLLVEKPISVLTPFVRGRVKLPTQDDSNRIRQYSQAAFISSNASRRSTLGREVEKRLKTLCNSVSSANNGFGAVRLRRIGKAWECSTFGDAAQL